MQTYNIHEAKTHLSRLIELAVQGEPFVIAKAGGPLVKVMALDSPDSSQKMRIGFLAGRLSVPDDFNGMGQEDVQSLFDGEREGK